MSIPSFDYIRKSDTVVKPRIHILAVRDKAKLDESIIAYIVVERTEKVKDYKEEGQIYESSICLDYQVLKAGQGYFRAGTSFHGGYSKFQNKVSLSSLNVSSGAIFLDLEGLHGQRIGSYLMNEIVSWVKQWPEAEVNPIRLSSAQATVDNKERRNRFYESFGLEFTYTDSDQKEGRSKPIKAGALKQNLKWQENIEVVEFIPFLENIMSKTNQQRMDLERYKGVAGRLCKENQSARDNPIKWGLKWTWYNNRGGFIVLCVIGLFGFAWWSRL